MVRSSTQGRASCPWRGIKNGRGTPRAPRNRGLWVKVKRLRREQFCRGRLNRSQRKAPAGLRALLLAHYDPDGRLVYGGAALSRARHTFGAGLPVDAAF